MFLRPGFNKPTAFGVYCLLFENCKSHLLPANLRRIVRVEIIKSDKGGSAFQKQPCLLSVEGIDWQGEVTVSVGLFCN